MQTAKTKRSSLLPVLGFFGASGLFLWWAAKSPNQQATKTLPPSETKWQTRVLVPLARSVFVAGKQVLSKGATVHAVSIGNDQYAVAAVVARKVGVKPDDLEWFEVGLSYVPNAKRD